MFGSSKEEFGVLIKFIFTTGSVSYMKSKKRCILCATNLSEEEHLDSNICSDCLINPYKDNNT